MLEEVFVDLKYVVRNTNSSASDIIKKSIVSGSFEFIGRNFNKIGNKILRKSSIPVIELKK